MEQINDNNLNINMRFSDTETLIIPINKNDLISKLIKMSIFTKCKLTDINYDDIPNELMSKFKFVFKGKVYKDYDLLISSINGLANNSIFHCIFPNITAAEITKLYDSIEESDENINTFLLSDNLRNILKNKKVFKFLTEYVKSYNSSENSVVTEQNPVITEQNININNSTFTINLDSIYKTQIEDLVTMGFENNDRVKQLLDKYKGDIQLVINELFV